MSIFFNSALYPSKTKVKPWSFNFPLKYNTIEKTEELVVNFGLKEVNDKIVLADFQKNLLSKKQKAAPDAQMMDFEDADPNKLQAFSLKMSN